MIKIGVIADDRQVAEREFDRKNSYKEIVNLINDLIGEDKNVN